jgi:translation initiation factor 2B subunit (eIF-2B alpha/beta/delta family)
MYQNLFEKILQDNTSGSGTILEKTEQAILSLSGEKTVNMPELLRQLENLENRFPHFALLFHFLNALRDFAGNKTELPGKELFAHISQYRKKWGKAVQKAAENFLKDHSPDGKNILLHSHSSAIRGLFGLLAAKKIWPVVWQTVSSPVNEGLLQASFLKQAGFQVHLLHEDAVSRFIDRIDMAVFGADLIWEEGFLNKAGTFPLALLMKYFGKPVYVLAESRKIIKRQKVSPERFQRFLHEEPKPAGELFSPPQENLTVHNYYFEVVPVKLINRIFTEKR